MRNPLWAERYRPETIDEAILPAEVKETFRRLIKKKETPNLLFSGPAGVGKTTAARALAREMDMEIYEINGSMNGNIDTLRNEIMDFASTVSFEGKRKVVLLDEADHLNPQSTQPALRNFMEEFSGNCGFILTCNYPGKIIAPLKSRTSHVVFKFTKAERAELIKEFYLRVVSILEKEKIEFDPQAVGGLIAKHFPDWRKVLGELQMYASRGKIDSGVLSMSGDDHMVDLFRFMKDKDFTSVRKWVGENLDEPSVLFRKFYDLASLHFTADSIPQLVVILGEYQYKSAHVVDQEINTSAFLVHVMGSCTMR